MWFWSTKRGKLTAALIVGACLMYVGGLVWAHWSFIAPDFARNRYGFGMVSGLLATPTDTCRHNSAGLQNQCEA